MADPNRKCVLMLSGGLDSTLAGKMMLDQGLEVVAVNFKTPFDCCKHLAHRAAQELGLDLTVVEPAEDFLQMLRDPRHGFGRGVNPCMDCRIYMFRLAKRFMDKLGASFVVSGEVVGQRPKSQKRWDLPVVERESGLEDRLLRPLSAKILPITWPEREGIVDRSKLLGHSGRGRGKLLDVARKMGLTHLPSASPGCVLTQAPVARAVRDMLGRYDRTTWWDFELLRTGRQLILTPDVRVALGRNKEQNTRLQALHAAAEARPHVYIAPADFKGPEALVLGEPSTEALQSVAQLILHYSKRYDPDRVALNIESGETSTELPVTPGSVPDYEDLGQGTIVRNGEIAETRLR